MGDSEYRSISDDELVAIREQLATMSNGRRGLLHEDGRPKLSVEIASEAKRFDDFIDLFGRPPHCDQRVLHQASACEFCARAIGQQHEREQLGVRNTGAPDPQPGRPHPCPAELARSPESLASWVGNRPMSDVDYVASTLRSPGVVLGNPDEGQLCQTCGEDDGRCLCGLGL